MDKTDENYEYWLECTSDEWTAYDDWQSDNLTKLKDMFVEMREAEFQNFCRDCYREECRELE